MTENAEWARQRIFELALNIARLQCHAAYIDNEGQMTLLSHDSVEGYIHHFREEIEHEAKSVLMHGGWEDLP